MDAARIEGTDGPRRPATDTRAGAFADLLAASYASRVGEPLLPPQVRGQAAAGWLYEAGFALLAHDASPDPVFVYANRTAQDLFEYSWEQFVGLPSRLSAEADARQARADLLDGVRRHGFTHDYQGWRVAGSGRRFRISGVTVWNLAEADGAPVGQAALIRRWADA